MNEYEHGVHVGEVYVNKQGLEIVVLEVCNHTILWTAVGFEDTLPGAWWTVGTFHEAFQRRDTNVQEPVKPKPGQTWKNKTFHNVLVEVARIRKGDGVVFYRCGDDTLWDWPEAFVERYKLVVDVKE